MRARRCGSVGEAWVQATKVFLNGRWIGAHRAPDELKKALLKLRRSVSISEDVSVVYDHSLNELRLNNDWGRVCRPLYVVDECSINLTKGEIRELKARPALPAAARGTWLERAAAPPPPRARHACPRCRCVCIVELGRICGATSRRHHVAVAVGVCAVRPGAACRVAVVKGAACAARIMRSTQRGASV